MQAKIYENIPNLGSQTFPVEMNALFGFGVNDKTLSDQLYS